jgi:hypothetical protein
MILNSRSPLGRGIVTPTPSPAVTRDTARAPTQTHSAQPHPPMPRPPRPHRPKSLPSNPPKSSYVSPPAASSELGTLPSPALQGGNTSVGMWFGEAAKSASFTTSGMFSPHFLPQFFLIRSHLGPMSTLSFTDSMIKLGTEAPIT